MTTEEKNAQVMSALRLAQATRIRMARLRKEIHAAGRDKGREVAAEAVLTGYADTLTPRRLLRAIRGFGPGVIEAFGTAVGVDLDKRIGLPGAHPTLGYLTERERRELAAAILDPASRDIRGLRLLPAVETPEWDMRAAA